MALTSWKYFITKHIRKKKNYIVKNLLNKTRRIIEPFFFSCEAFDKNISKS